MKHRSLCSIVVATVVGISALTSATLAWAQAPGAAKVQVEPIKFGVLPGSFTFVGTVHPTRRAVLGSAVDGRLEKIVNDGMWVEKEEPIALLRTRTIDLEIDAAVAEQELREHELDEMKEGPRMEERKMARAKFESTEALSEYAKARYDRTKSLFDRGQATSKEEVEQALSAFVAADRARAAAESEHKLAEEGTRAERIKQAADRLAMQTAVVEQLKDRRDKYWVRPYFNGYVTQKFAEEGAWVKQGDPLVEVAELDNVEITVNVPEAFIAKVRPDMDVQVRVDAVSLRDAWPGKVHRIVPQADLRSRTFAVKVQLKNVEEGAATEQPVSAQATAEQPAEQPAPKNRNPTEIDPGARKNHTFKSGMLAHVALRLGEKQEAILIPKDALVLGGSAIGGQPTYQVFVAKSDDGGKTYTAQAVQVAIGTYEGDLVEVATKSPEDLPKGTLLVTVGNERLRPGQAIQFTK